MTTVPSPAAAGPASPAAPPALVLTGERTLPGIPVENYWFRRHEAAYAWLLPRVRDSRVLEAGAGEGYGADLLASAADRVLAVDYDDAAARHARARYPRLGVARADLQRLPVADTSVDVVANLQVLEHLHDQAGFLAECARVLRPGGLLALTTPNRLTFSPDHVAGTPHLNPFHTRELDAGELAGLLARHFDDVEVLGLRHGEALRAFEREHGGLVAAQLAGPPETWSPPVRSRVEAVTVADFEVTPVDVDASLDLVAVAVRRPGR